MPFVAMSLASIYCCSSLAAKNILFRTGRYKMVGIYARSVFACFAANTTTRFVVAIMVEVHSKRNGTEFHFPSDNVCSLVPAIEPEVPVAPTVLRSCPEPTTALVLLDFRPEPFLVSHQPSWRFRISLMSVFLDRGSSSLSLSLIPRDLAMSLTSPLSISRSSSSSYSSSSS